MAGAVTWVGLGLMVGLVTAGCGQAATGDDPVSGSSSAPAPGEVARASSTSDDAEALAKGLNEVGFALFEYAAADSTADVVLSPLSIGLAFGMADVGATGATADALQQLFDYPVDGEDRWSAFNTLDQDATDVGEPVVRLANRQYPDVSFETAPGYDETLRRWFGAGIEPLPLQEQPEQSRARINEWVAEQTEQLIPQLVPEGMINGESVMLLVNALYLQADWARPFGKYPTEDTPFTRLDGSQVTVPLMHELELSGPAVATDTYAATEIPYEGGELSMLVIVPEEGHYPQVEDDLSNELVAEIDAAATGGAVELWLPRFESETRLDLYEAFEGLGVDGVFGPGGSWEGIAPGIFLASGVHAADISVDEYGTVAAAATALGFEESGPPQPDVTVRADKPFLYLIRHEPTGAVLFVGRVTDPSA
jgi:serpin B